jgi:hypothetical protein
MRQTLSGAALKDRNGRRSMRADDYRFAGGETERPQFSAKPVAQIASILGRANFHCVVSALRVGLRATKRLCEGHLRLMNHMMQPDSPREQALRIIVDETRSCLREVSEVSSQEVGRLRVELGKLQEEAREIVSESESVSEPGSPARKYNRGWKAKP